jgi:hypothetical protein
MLAITHHMVMQLCSKLINPLSTSWEDRYEVLGDDIVIFNAALANTYLSVMAKLGVPINESKSVIATCSPVVEFAKRLAIAGREVSALPWKNLISQDSFLGRLSSAISLLMKEKSFLSNPFFVIHTLLKRTKYDERPMTDISALINLLVTFAEQAGVSRLDLIKLILSLDPKIDGKTFSFKNLDFKFLRKVLLTLILDKKLISGIEYHPNFLAIKEQLLKIYENKINRYKKLYPGWKVRMMQAEILRAMVLDFVPVKWDNSTPKPVKDL